VAGPVTTTACGSDVQVSINTDMSVSIKMNLLTHSEFDARLQTADNQSEISITALNFSG
jgi:hypothetical protein